MEQQRNHDKAVQRVLAWIANVRGGREQLECPGFPSLAEICKAHLAAGAEFDEMTLREAHRLDWIMRARKSGAGRT